MEVEKTTSFLLENEREGSVFLLFRLETSLRYLRLSLSHASFLIREEVGIIAECFMKLWERGCVKKTAVIYSCDLLQSRTYHILILNKSTDWLTFFVAVFNNYIKSLFHSSASLRPSFFLLCKTWNLKKNLTYFIQLTHYNPCSTRAR